MVCRDVVSWNTMINGYALVGSIKEAKRLFDEMPERNVVYWNSMLAGYVKCGDVEGHFEVSYNKWPTPTIGPKRGLDYHGCKAIIDMKEKRDGPVYPAVMNDETLHEHVEMVGGTFSVRECQVCVTRCWQVKTLLSIKK
ncbi:hypothetical protein IFM89_017861 [Coptis chinensis]|uniref:Pentatricopeptide repeat-containing protein n=1 Tax=Coptis chinensis TaxID=261450 RepID=A0A835MA04_9MAGN|nr:hypothetical protein IFM89_017861 [Coptis chinensis]